MIGMEKKHKKVFNMFTGILGDFLEGKCAGQNGSLLTEKVINFVASKGEATSNLDNPENVFQDPALTDGLEEIAQEFGLSSEIIQELHDKWPELLKSAEYMVEYIDSQFRTLQESVLVIQKQMHMDKISKYESIYKQIDKKKYESNIEKDEWVRTVENLADTIESLAGEMKTHIEVCNKAPKNINLKTLFQFLRDRQVNSKQIRESLQILQEDLNLYERGIAQMFELEQYYINRANSSQKTLRDAIDFLTQWFRGDEENIMYILTGDDFWIENPQRYCNILHNILQELDTKMLVIKD